MRSKSTARQMMTSLSLSLHGAHKLKKAKESNRHWFGLCSWSVSEMVNHKNRVPHYLKFRLLEYSGKGIDSDAQSATLGMFDS